MTGSTALIAVVVTSLASYLIQLRTKSRDFTLAQVQERSLQTRDAIMSIYDLLARMLKAKEEQLKLAQGYYDDFPRDQQQAIVNESNGTDQRWRHDKESSEMLVYLYFGDSGTVAAWSATKDAMQNYSQCVERIYRKYQGSRAPERACDAESGATMKALGSLRAHFVERYQGVLAP